MNDEKNLFESICTSNQIYAIHKFDYLDNGGAISKKWK